MRMIFVARPITTDTDKGRKRILRQMAKVKGSHVSIGLHEDEQPYGDGTRVQDVGYWHEFGVGQAERSWLRSTFDENRRKWRRRTKVLLASVILGRTTVERSLRQLGFEMKNEVQNKIETMRTPGNAPSTIAQKPTIGDNPLINTRKLKRSVKSKVHLKTLLGFK